MLYFVITFCVGGFSEQIPHLQHFFAWHLAEFIGTIIAVLLLNQKYPLDVAFRLNSAQVIKYVLPATLLVLLMGGFPYAVLFKRIAFPEEYAFFIDFGLFGKFLFILVVCIVVPFLEEIFYRGFIYRLIRTDFGMPWGMVISTALSSFGHISINFHIVIASLLYAYVYEKTSNIWSSIVVHLLNNTIWLIFVYWGSQRAGA